MKYLFILLVWYSIERIDSGVYRIILWVRLNVNVVINERFKGLVVIGKIYMFLWVMNWEYGMKFKLLFYKDFVKELFFFKIRLLFRDVWGF